MPRRWPGQSSISCRGGRRSRSACWRATSTTRATPGATPLDAVDRYFESVAGAAAAAGGARRAAAPASRSCNWRRSRRRRWRNRCSARTWNRPRCLGRRTAEMHIALASETDLPHFGREPFSQLYQRSLYQAVRNLAGRTFSMLRRRLGRRARPTFENARQGRHGPRGPGLRAAAPHRAAEDRRHAHPLPRRLPPGAGPLYGQRFRDRRFRGRADPLDQRAATQGIALPRRGGHAPFVRLRLLLGPGRPDQPAWCSSPRNRRGSTAGCSSGRRGPARRS